MSQSTPSQDEPTYQQRIDALRQTKAEHTALKIELFGHFDTDDHGYIPWTDPIPFKAVPNHPSGGCWGIRGIGENFRRWLEAHPLYIHPMSSLAGAWVYKSIPGVAGHDWPRVRGQASPQRARRDRDDGRIAGNHQRGGHGAGHGHYRADGEIDALGGDHACHADRQDGHGCAAVEHVDEAAEEAAVLPAYVEEAGKQQPVDDEHAGKRRHLRAHQEVPDSLHHAASPSP